MAPMSRFELRIEDDLIERIDEWAAEQRDGPTRAEAARRLIERGLTAGTRQSVHFSDGEKALIVMMSELFKHIGVEDHEASPHFLADVIFGGHYWAPKWDMQGLFHDHVDNPREVSHVVNVLDMWNFIESVYERLSPADKAQIERDAEPFGKHVKFDGFDGNNESSQMGIARFLIKEMKRFGRFKDRELNSHFPTYARYRHMLELFEPMRKTLGLGNDLSAEQITTLLKAGEEAL